MINHTFLLNYSIIADGSTVTTTAVADRWRHTQQEDGAESSVRMIKRHWK